MPPEFKKHRYLTEGEAARTFIDPEFQGIESTRYACRSFKRLFYLMKEHPDDFGTEVTDTYRAFEAGLIARQEQVERTALALYEAGKDDLARQYLTYYSGTEAMNGLRLGDALAEGIEARTKVLYGIRLPARGTE